MTTNSYPIELKQRLYELSQNMDLPKALAVIWQEFPKYKRRLTLPRAYQVNHWFTGHQNQQVTPQEKAGERTRWMHASDDQRKKVLDKAKRLHSEHIRWKVIVERLQKKYPTLAIPMAANLARIAGANNNNKLTMKSSLSQKCLVLQISNSGSMNFKVEITPDTACRVIQECLA